ncbi:MAG TPA: hypothetical protein VFI74_03100 [Candidatus Saccharimonadales bacterium]|nr:hypothetical protein [Candidatus Saccharimonadales bacterium]
MAKKHKRSSKKKQPLAFMPNILILGFALFVLAGVFLFSNIASGSTLRGKIVCLPKKGTGPHTLECNFGLRTSDGRYYTLRSADGSPMQLYQYDTAKQVEVRGSIRSYNSDVYNVNGIVDVDSIVVKQ